MFKSIKKSRRSKKRNKGGSIERQDHQVQVVKMPRTFYGFPPRLQARLRYSSANDLTYLGSIAGSFITDGFRANSIFDPDYSGTGHQPMYRDTYAAVYDHYAVVSSTISVTFINTSATSYWNCGLYVDDDTTFVTTAAQLEEQPSAVNSFLGPLASSKSIVTLTNSWSCVKNLGIDPYSSQTYKTAMGSNPSEESYYVIAGNDLSGGTTNLIFKVEIVYDVLFTELNTQALS